MYYDEFLEFMEFCIDNCSTLYQFNSTICTESDYVDCLMYPKRILNLEYLVPATILLSCLFLSGLIGNLSVCMVIAKHPGMRSETNAYLFSLAVSDLILLVFGLPSDLWHYWQTYPYIFGDFWCPFNHFMCTTGTWASVLTVVAFSIERYEAICYPLRSLSRSGSRVRIAILTIWTLSVASALPVLHVYHVAPVVGYPPEGTTEQYLSPLSRVCFVSNGPEYKYFNFLYIVIVIPFFLIPMTILLVMSIKIALHLRIHRQSTRNCDIPNSCSENRKISAMLVAVVIAFFICGAPFHFFHWLMISEYSWNNNSYDDLNSPRGAKVLTDIFFYFSATLNPIIYNAMSKRYQRAFLDIFWARNGTPQNRNTNANDIQLRGNHVAEEDDVIV